MLEPSKRLPTLVLAAGIIVLLIAIALGEHMGEQVLGQASDHPDLTQIRITPAPDQTSAPYGPDWKRSSTLSAASDPGFPDPRIPPVPLPTRPPAPSPTPSPRPGPTLNPNIPIWRQTPIPTGTPTGQTPTPSPSAAASPTPTPSP
ncbi:MAG TPA: hypothetical protein VMW12_08485 [Candidatus Dormibacteraeota bacterium]|nr:hypothetical protein [Candidatus Dormibacteraeota bacterium]